MLIKPIQNCQLCKHDRILRDLKTRVAEIQVEMRVEWKSLPVIQIQDPLLLDKDKDKDKDNWFLMNLKERAMVIPSYPSYDKTWKKAMFLNPFEVDWMLFEIHGSTDVEYVISLIEILEDQKSLWKNDEETCDEPIFILFVRFISAVKRLLLYCLSATSLAY
jgi:hypothetical protein